MFVILECQRPRLAQIKTFASDVQKMQVRTSTEQLLEAFGGDGI